MEQNPTHRIEKGIAVSEGVAIGRVWILESPWDKVASTSLSQEKIDPELRRYARALVEVEKQLGEYRERVETELGKEEAKIFHAHLMILKDPFFQSEIPDGIKQLKLNAESVLKSKLDHTRETFRQLGNEFFQLRIADIQDVAVRILSELLQTESLTPMPDDATIWVAHMLNPSDIARIGDHSVEGFITEMGGETSHVSILARAMGIPAVVGVEGLLQKVKNGMSLVVDGNTGLVHIEPDKHTLKGYRIRKKQFAAYWKRLSKDFKLPSVTRDGVSVSLLANVSMTADLSLAVRHGAEGIGLFRTELPFLIAGKLLSEEEQFSIYRTVVEAMKNRSVTIRTLDLGGDKFLPFQGLEKEKNPFLGWRSIRIFLQERDIFKTQIRAILRSSQFGKVRIMFPMISSLDEILEINGLVEETKNDLRKDGIPFDETIQTGIMVEVPSAAIMADKLIEHTDFFSIGTNDLIQYTLAVDRNNEKVAKFYQPLNPAILILIQKTIRAAVNKGKSVSICGEMAGSPLYTAMFVGMGIRQLSMSPLVVPEVKERIRAISVDECGDLVNRIMTLSSSDEIEPVLRTFNDRANLQQSVPFFQQTDPCESRRRMKR